MSPGVVVWSVGGSGNRVIDVLQVREFSVDLERELIGLVNVEHPLIVGVVVRSPQTGQKDTLTGLAFSLHPHLNGEGGLTGSRHLPIHFNEVVVATTGDRELNSPSEAVFPAIAGCLSECGRCGPTNEDDAQQEQSCYGSDHRL